MDYSYYPPTTQPFFPLLPPTPTHTNSSNTDEFGNSPPVLTPAEMDGM